MLFRPEYLNGILPLNPVRMVHILIKIQADQLMNKSQMPKAYVQSRAKLVGDKHLEEAMHNIEAAIKLSYPSSVS